LEFSSDGQLLATAGHDGRARLWDVETGKEVWQSDVPISPFDRGPCPAPAIVFCPSQRALAYITSREERINILDLTSRKSVLGIQIGMDTEVLIFSPDGRLLATIGSGGKLRLWDWNSGQELARFDIHRLVWDKPVAFSSDNKLLAYSAPDKTIRLYDLQGQREIRKFPKDFDAGYLAFVSGDKALLVCPPTLGPLGAGWMHTFEVASGKELRQFTETRPRAIAISYDKKIAATQQLGYNAVRLIAVDTAESFRTIPIDDGSLRVVMTFSPDGKQLASCGKDHVIRIWDVTTGNEIHSSPGRRGAILAARFSQKDGSIVTASSDNTLRSWDACSGKLLRKIRCGLGTRLTADISTDTEYLAWPGEEVAILSTRTGKQLRTLKTQNHLMRRPEWLNFSPDGKWLAVCTQFMGAGIWASASGVSVYQLLGDEGVGLDWITAAPAFAVDGSELALATQNLRLFSSKIRIWNLVSRKSPRVVDFGHKVVGALAFSPDSRWLAAGDNSGAIHLLRRTSGEQEGRMVVGDPITCLLFSPDSRTLLAGTAAGTIHVLEMASREVRRTWTGHSGDVCRLAFAVDCRRFLSGSQDTTVLVWDLFGPDQKQSGATTGVSVDELDLSWHDLSRTDARCAGDAISKLISSADDAVSFLGGRLHSVQPVHPKEIEQHIVNLDSTSFMVRKKAMDALERIGDLAEPLLRRHLAEGPSPEASQRIAQLLGKLSPGATGTRLRSMRAVEILEQIGTARARAILVDLSLGAPGALLTKEANAALYRLDLRPVGTR
jgi:WD40 repeat protein